MEIFTPDFTRPPLDYLLAAVATVLCVVVTVIRWSKPKWNRPDSTTSAAVLSGACSCPCACGTDAESAQPVAMGPPEKQNGGTSMIELPEIRTHVLSYLDYTSLCKLSMTNSLMRKAANDDNAWKALYHKDFWVEQDAVIPANGWKAYYAATREIMNVIEHFQKATVTWDISLMNQMWLNADYIKFIQTSDFDSGYDAVMHNGWGGPISSDELVNDMEFREVRIRVTKDIAWVTLKFYVGEKEPPERLNESCVFEYHNGRWYMVLFHSSSCY